GFPRELSPRDPNKGGHEMTKLKRAAIRPAHDARTDEQLAIGALALNLRWQLDTDAPDIVRDAIALISELVNVSPEVRAAAVARVTRSHPELWKFYTTCARRKDQRMIDGKTADQPELQAAK